MFNSILVICTGNICRSPIGERLLRDAFPQKKIDSAGTGALVGHPADPASVLVAEKHGLSLEGHMARQLNRKMLGEYDLILVMDKDHTKYIDKIAPEAIGKVMLFGHWIDEKDIPDPYKKSQEAFEFVWNLLEQANKGWIKQLKK